MFLKQNKNKIPRIVLQYSNYCTQSDDLNCAESQHSFYKLKNQLANLWLHPISGQIEIQLARHYTIVRLYVWLSTRKKFGELYCYILSVVFFTMLVFLEKQLITIKSTVGDSYNFIELV